VFRPWSSGMDGRMIVAVTRFSAHRVSGAEAGTNAQLHQ
jgi:hypothetical protein